MRINIGKLTPVITSMSSIFLKPLAMLLGVEPYMSVRINTPLPSLMEVNMACALLCWESGLQLGDTESARQFKGSVPPNVELAVASNSSPISP